MYFGLLVCAFIIRNVDAGFSEYVNSITGYFGFSNAKVSEEDVDQFSIRIPYEVSTMDEKFISEAAKLTGVALSELDSCQQRVVLKLQVDCDKMNDEQLAKMAVHLLNCQSFVEGRKIYPCTDEMSIRQCTIDMDSDTWTSYHLMSNRARAVCYAVRQVQFRGLAEHTVNSLMHAARDQLGTLKKIANDQREIKDIAESAHNVLYKGQNELLQQHKDLQRAQLHGQLTLEDNLKRLVDEKKLISESHGELMRMTWDLQQKLELSSKQIDLQTDNSKLNHNELLQDLLAIQEKANNIFQKIEQSSELLMKQNEQLHLQYQSTLKNLNEVNRTVYSLVSLVGGTRQALEERLAWISSALGGTDLAVDRIYMIIWHACFLLVAMVSCAFLTARYSTRLLVAMLPPVNLAVALYEGDRHLDIFELAASIGAFIVGQMFFLWIWEVYNSPLKRLIWPKKELVATTVSRSRHSSVHLAPSIDLDQIDEAEERESSVAKTDYFDFSRHTNLLDDDFDFRTPLVTNPTPPLSRNGFYSPRSRSRSNTPITRLNTRSSSCIAKTRLGTPCKLSAIPGRDFCHRHQTGDSILG